MTVILHTHAGAPALAGDMLISRKGPHGSTDLRLPSLPDGIVVPMGKPPDYIPVRMRRKVFIVNEHLSVGAAGSVSHIATFIRVLTEAFGAQPEVTFADVTACLDRFAATDDGGRVSRRIGALILVEATDRSDWIQFGAAAATTVNSTRFGTAVAIGTGAGPVIDQITKLDGYSYYGMPQPAADHDDFPEFATLAENVGLLANVYWRELASPTNVFDAWGGAYDLIYQDARKRFRYLDSYTLFVRTFDAKRPDQGIQLANILKYERRPSASVIATTDGQQLDWFGAKDITASDAPVSLRVGGRDFTMNSDVHVTILAVGTGNRYLAPLFQIDGLDPQRRSKQTVFTDFDEDYHLRVLFHAEHDAWLAQEATSYYGENARLFD